MMVTIVGFEYKKGEMYLPAYSSYTLGLILTDFMGEGFISES